jgi:hypothetical protein
MKKKVLIWELAGAIFIAALGSLLHFTFEWFNHWKPIGAFSAVNESVWEHLKLGFWPALLFLVIEYKFINSRTNNFFTAKAAGIYLIPITIIILFYSYTAILGRHLLFIDISIFFISVFLGQFVSYKLLKIHKLSKVFEFVSIFLIILLAVLFVVFTFYPPNIGFFMDPRWGGYGIQ